MQDLCSIHLRWSLDKTLGEPPVLRRVRSAFSPQSAGRAGHRGMLNPPLVDLNPMHAG